VGILGAGQLGCMLAESLFRYGAQVHFYDVDPQAPGRHRTPFFTCADWQNREALQTFAKQCDVLTYEFENVNPEHLFALPRPTFPNPKVLQTTQYRSLEKEFLTSAQLPCTPHVVLNTIEDLNLFCQSFQPAIVKTLFGGYDGKGQWKVQTPHELHLLSKHLPLVAEEPLALVSEASVVVARGQNKSSLSVLGPFENIHHNHILDHTVFPASFPPDLQNTLIELAHIATQKLDVVGLLTTEFFICSKASLWTHMPRVQGHMFPCGKYHLAVNEFAPRPHNSGHVSRVAVPHSQFDLLARVLLNLPLPVRQQPLSAGVYVMGNLLGEHVTEPNKLERHKFMECEEVTLYGKTTSRPGRKMGHFCYHRAEETSAERLTTLRSLRS
jgi:5-(carboxyamino)imidazole ribonucleotide synthase